MTPPWRRLAALAIVGVVGSAFASAAPRPLDLFELAAPTFTTFTAATGAPEDVVYSVAVDGQGFVWLASPSEFARYDGQRWEPEPPPAPGLRVTRVLRDDRGVLWAAGDESWVAHRESGRWVVETVPAEHVYRLVMVPAREGPADLFVLCTGGVLLRHAGTRWINEDPRRRLPALRLESVARTLALTGGERLWAWAGGGLWSRDPGGEWQPDPRFPEGQATDMLAVRSAGGEALWICTFGQGLFRVTRDGITRWQEADGTLASDMLYDLAATEDGSGEPIVWASSRGGLVRVHDGRAQAFERRHGLPSSAVRSIHLWRSPSGTDVLWMGTEGGVARAAVGQSSWQVASLLGSAGNGVFGVLVEPDGRGGERLWVASSKDGVGLYQDGRWQVFGRAEGDLPSANPRLLVRAADEDGQAVLWTDADGHLLRVDERTPGRPRFREVPTPWDKRSGQAVLDLVATRASGRYQRLVGTRLSGLFAWSGGRWTEVRPPGVTGQWRVARIVEQSDPAGTRWLWASSSKGLLRGDGASWTLLGREIGLPETELLSISLIPDPDGRPVLWAGSLSGIVRIDVSDPQRPRALPAQDLPAPPHPDVYGALRDSRGRIYLCTDSGVQQLVAEGGRWTARVFTRRDGMGHDECNLGAQAIDAHDRYWVGTLGGLSVYDPTVPPDRVPKTLAVTRVLVDGVEAAADGLRIPPGTREVRAEFALLSWQRESESRFRTQLVGYDPAPTAWTAQGSRLLGTLPPGLYTLRIEARDYAGLASAPREITLEVVPAWWQRLAFRALLAAVFLLAGPLAYFVRVRQLSSQKAALARLVASRTAELAEANTQLARLSRVDGLTGVANRRRLDEALDEEWRRAARQRHPVAFLLLDVDHFKAYNDLLGHPAGDECLKRVAEAVQGMHARAGDLVARYGGEEFAILLPGLDGPAARAAAERVRTRVAEMGLPHPGVPTAAIITVSVGVASQAPTDGARASDLVAAADRALYAAKRGGRNRVASA